MENENNKILEIMKQRGFVPHVQPKNKKEAFLRKFERENEIISNDYERRRLREKMLFELIGFTKLDK